MLKGGSSQPSSKQLNQRVGVKPSLADCLDGLLLLHEMHHAEYETNLSSSIKKKKKLIYHLALDYFFNALFHFLYGEPLQDIGCNLLRKFYMKVE